jgi:anion-transporting  ArsA/GET3 family ATPase
VTPRHRLHIVSGKGGTGKTTIAAALACALATTGRRVLLCEVEGRQGIAELFGASRLVDAEERRVCRTPSSGAVHALSIDAEAALLEYLETFYHLGLAAKALERFRVVDFATSIAPGLRDVLLTGKVYEAVRRGEKNHPNSYDAVVLDAPPTGRIAQFLNVHQAVAGLARVGPIRGQADSIMRMLRSTTTAVHLVTLLEDMPVTETEEAVAALRPTGISVETVIANKVIPTPLDEVQLQRAAMGTTLLRVRALNDQQNRLLTAEFADEAARTLQQRDRHRRLTSLGVPLAEIAFDAAGIDEAALFSIADQIRNQIPLEGDE